LLLGACTGADDLNIHRAWHSRRLAYSAEVIAIAMPGSEKLIDAIPLFELVEVVKMSNRDSQSDENSNTERPKKENNRINTDSEKLEKKYAGDKKCGDSNKVKFQHALQLQTKPDGYNSGRQYIIQAHSDDECQNILQELTKLSKIALDNFLSKSRFEKVQARATPSHPDKSPPVVSLLP
jgi:hypothetical protein